jgi:RNA polymerase sigma-70 factor (ECF subfamily)
MGGVRLNRGKKWKDVILKIAEKDDKYAFRELFDHFYDELRGVAFNYLKSNLYSDEIVTDVFISTWEKRAKLAEVEDISKYLFVLTRNKSIDYLRKLKGTNIIPLNPLDEIAHSHTADGGLLEEELATRIEQAIARLPEKTRLVFQMVRDEELKYREVADILNISIKTVEYHIGKALKQLKADLDNLEEPGGADKRRSGSYGILSSIFSIF